MKPCNPKSPLPYNLDPEFVFRLLYIRISERIQRKVLLNPRSGAGLQLSKLAEGGEGRISSAHRTHSQPLLQTPLFVTLTATTTTIQPTTSACPLLVLPCYDTPHCCLLFANGRRSLTRAVTLLGVPRCGWGFRAVVTSEPMGEAC